MDKKERLENEKQFQDSRVVKQEEKRFISDLDTLANSFNSLLLSLKGKKILNLGCGTGTMTADMARNGNEITAIDISPESIKELNKELKRLKVTKKAKAMLMDAEELKFKDDEFDIVYGAAILHHLNLRKAIPELKKVVNKGSKLYFIEPCAYNPLVKRYRKNTPQMRSRYEHPLTKRDLRIIKQHFPRLRLSGFYLLQTVMPSFIKHSDRMKGFRKFLDKVDILLLSIFPFLRYWSYSWIIKIEN